MPWAVDEKQRKKQTKTTITMTTIYDNDLAMKTWEGYGWKPFTSIKILSSNSLLAYCHLAKAPFTWLNSSRDDFHLIPGWLSSRCLAIYLWVFTWFGAKMGSGRKSSQDETHPGWNNSCKRGLSTCRLRDIYCNDNQSLNAHTHFSYAWHWSLVFATSSRWFIWLPVSYDWPE